MKWIALIPVLFLLSSCFEFDEVKFKGIESFKMPKIDEKEILLDVSVKIENPNNFKIKLKPSNLEVFIEEKMVGTIYLDKKVILKKRIEGIYSTQLRVKLEKGVMFSLMRYALKKEVPVRFKGRVRGAVYGLTKKVDIDQTQIISGDKFKMKMPF